MRNIHSISWMDITYNKFSYFINKNNTGVFFIHPWYNYKMEWVFFYDEFYNVLKLLDGSKNNKYLNYYFNKPVKYNLFCCKFLNNRVKEEFKDLFMEVNINTIIYKEFLKYEEYLEKDNDECFIINYNDELHSRAKSFPIKINNSKSFTNK